MAKNDVQKGDTIIIPATAAVGIGDERKLELVTDALTNRAAYSRVDLDAPLIPAGDAQ